MKPKRDRQYNSPNENGQTMIYKTLHRKLIIKQHEPYKKPVLNSRAMEGEAIPAPPLTPIVLLLNDTNII
jgi:hypothetical protein